MKNKVTLLLVTLLLVSIYFMFSKNTKFENNIQQKKEEVKRLDSIISANDSVIIKLELDKKKIKRKYEYYKYKYNEAINNYNNLNRSERILATKQLLYKQ